MEEYGYLPAPFFHDTTDTFMDWYNTAYWAQHGMAYDIWGAVYPPTAILFEKIFSIRGCYSTNPMIGRMCDPVGVVVLSCILPVNTLLSYFAFRKLGIRTAIPRAIAIGFGAPMLLAWERGNLIIPCFTVLVLAYSRLLKPARIKAACAALALCFKPYLIVLIAGALVKRRWRWLEAVGLFFIVIYAVSYVILGEGSPFQLVRDLGGFGHNLLLPSLYSIRFAVTYAELIKLIDAPYPIMHFIGSKPLEVLDFVLPLVLNIGKIGVAICFLGAFIYRKALSTNRLYALIMCLFFTVDDAGGYALCFLLFFLFSEKSGGLLSFVVLVCAYLWCIPWDYPVTTVDARVAYSYLTGKTVFENVEITVGQFVRPALFSLIEYVLILMSLLDLASRARSMRASRTRPAREPLATAASLSAT